MELYARDSQNLFSVVLYDSVLPLPPNKPTSSPESPDRESERERRIGPAAGLDRGIVRGTISPSLQIMEREREKKMEEGPQSQNFHCSYVEIYTIAVLGPNSAKAGASHKTCTPRKGMRFC